jgi:hypothetical protein
MLSLNTSNSSIDRIHFSAVTPKMFYSKYRAKNKPVVITGVFDGIAEWSLDVMSGMLGDDTYLVRVYGKEYRSKPITEWKQLCTVGEYTVREYVRLLRDGTARQNGMYMAQVPFGKTPLAETIRDRVVQLERKCGMERTDPNMDLNLWLGPAGHTEPLHFDGGDGTLMQLHGVKEVTLFPPSQTANLYPFPFFRTIPPWFSQVAMKPADRPCFPGYEIAIKHHLSVRLEQSDVLFIPVGWWHEVTALGDDYVCSVNRFWRVKPAWRNFSSSRSTAIWVLQRLPHRLLLMFDAIMHKRGQQN